MVTREQLDDPSFERKIAKILAQIHLVPIPDDMPRNWEAKEGVQRCLIELAKQKPTDPEAGEWYRANIAGRLY